LWGIITIPSQSSSISPKGNLPGMGKYGKLFCLLCALALFRLWVSGSFELALDEGYYWLWSRHLSLSYYDHPPMVAVMIALTTLAGGSEMFVRLGAVAGSVFTSIFLYMLATRLFGNEKAGWHTIWLANITLIFAAGSLIVSPDTPLVPFYVAAMILFLDATESRNSPNATLKWAAAGVVIGLAMLSKYTAVFFFPGAFLFLLLSKEKRGWLSRPQPYLAAAVSVAVFSPVLIWNWRHHWLSFSFQAGHGLSPLAGNPLKHVLDFIGFQAILYSIGIFFFLIAGGVVLIRHAFSAKTQPRARESALFLFSFAAPTLLFFSFNSLRATVEGNWPILGFIPLITQAGGMTEEWLASRHTRKPFIASAGLALVLFAFLHIQVVDPVIPHPKRFEISRRIYGWKTLGAEIDAVRESFPAAFLIADRFQTGTLMTYYTGAHIPAYQIGSDNTRRYTFLPPVDGYRGQNALYLAEESRDDAGKLAPLFDKTEKTRTVEITRKGELIRRFVLYKCYNYRGGLDIDR